MATDYIKQRYYVKKIMTVMLMVLPIAAWAGIDDDLIRAAGNGQKAKVEELIVQGANVKYYNNIGFTAIVRAADSWSNDAEAIITLLLSKGADINAKDGEGRTALTAAIRRGLDKRVKFLISKGADVNSTENDGTTPLSIAISANNTLIEKLLRAAGAKE